MRQLKLLVILFSVFASSVGATECPQFYHSGAEPKAEERNTVELCYSKFTVRYSLDKKVALWSAEKLTPDDVLHKSGVKRRDQFHPEQRLPQEARATLSDYIKSGYDRGHLTPDRDFPEEFDVDSLANIVPQDPVMNRGRWAKLEKAVRESAATSTIYVITGTAFLDTPAKFIGDRVTVPSHMFKVVTTNGKTTAWVSKNTPDAVVEEWDIEFLEILTGAKFIF